MRSARWGPLVLVTGEPFHRTFNGFHNLFVTSTFDLKSRYGVVVYPYSRVKVRRGEKRSPVVVSPGIPTSGSPSPTSERDVRDSRGYGKPHTVSSGTAIVDLRFYLGLQ